MTMDGPIEKKALFAQTRVQQALEAGAHYIDADDVREALDGFKGALDCQFGVHNDLPARISDLETQLFHYRVNAGGSEVLLDGAIKTRDRLVDYFRYVEESVPFAKAAEARERGTAIVDGMSWLIREAGNSRLAVQAVKAQRNQLEAKLSEAQVALDASHGISRAFDYQNMQLTAQVRAMKEHAQELQIALDASQGQVRQVEAETEELRDLADRQAGLLSRTAIAIRGPEPDLTRWSHHDLPELAAAMRKQSDICASAANKIQWATPDYAHQEGVCPECGQYEHDGHSEGCMVGRACGIYDVLRFTGALK